MNQKDEKRARLRDGMARPGVGLFVDDRAKASNDRAYAYVVESCGERNFTEEENLWLKEHLIKTVREYWADSDYDDRASAVSIRNEVEPFFQALGKVAKTVEKLSADTRAALRAEWRNATRDEGSDPINMLLQQIRHVEAICEPIASFKGAKGRRTQDRVARCCASLWTIRERLTGSPFSKSFELECDGRGIQTGRFERPDAQFVLAALKAIDDKVTIAQVTDGLRSHPASEARGK